MLDVTRLVIFNRVARTGSIAKAAKELGYTASAVSQQLTKLEREVGAMLALRSHSGIQLTNEGRLLHRHADRVLRDLGAAEQAVRDAAAQRSQELRLASFASAALKLLTPAITRFRVARPDVRLSLTEVEPPDGYDAVRVGDLDLLVTHVYPGVSPPDTDGLVDEELLIDPFVVVVPAGHDLPASTTALSVADLRDLPLISGGPDHANRAALERTFADAGISPRVEFEIRDYAVTLALVAGGAGASVVPWSVVSTAPPGIRVLTLDRGEARRMMVLHRPMTDRSIGTAFLHELRTAVSDLGEVCDRNARPPNS
jgi:DNA-binding transcriptional LysR family regulator